MDEYIWRPLKTVSVQPKKAVWTPAIDYMVAKRIYRLQAKPDGKWTIDKKDCSADGDASLTKPSQGLPCSDSPKGALIAKIGGGTADNKGTIRAIGRYHVLQLDDSQVGPLYLGINELPEALTKIDGEIVVDVEIAL